MIFRRRFAGETDAMLVSLVAKGNESAFREVMGLHQEAIYGFAFRFLKDAQEAEDIAQEVFLRLYQTAADYKPRASLRTYLFWIAKNLCIDSLRKKRPDTMDELPENIDTRTAFEQLSNAESLQRLLEAVSNLPGNQRAAILLRHEQGMHYQEIADALSITVSAVESLLVRARRTLRDRLHDLR